MACAAQSKELTNIPMNTIFYLKSILFEYVDTCFILI